MSITPPSPLLAGRLFAPGSAVGESCLVELGAAAAIASVGDRGYELGWAVTEIALGGSEESTLVLACAGEGGGRLTLHVAREEGLRRLREQGPSRLRPVLDRLEAERGRWRWRLLLGGITVAGVGALVVWAVIATIGLAVGWGLSRVPPTWEAELGRTLIERLAPATDRVEEPAVRAAVSAISGRLLLAASPPPGYDFQVHVVRSPEVNAFALPGGAIALNSALVAECASPEELAAVLAHEIQHVLRRHSLTQIGQRFKWSLALALLAGDLGGVREMVVARAADFGALRHSRMAETEADRLGFELLVRAGVDPRGMVSFFDRMAASEAAKGGIGLRFTSTHPGSESRSEAVRRWIETEAPAAVAPFAIDWPAVRSAAAGDGS